MSLQKKPASSPSTVTLPDGVSEEAWEKALTSALNSYKSTVTNTVGTHSLRLVSKNTKTVSEASMIQTQNSREKEILNAKDSYETAKNSLSEGTANIVDSLIENSPTATDIASFREALDIEWETYEAEAQKHQEVLMKEYYEKTTAEEEPVITPEPVTVHRFEIKKSNSGICVRCFSVRYRLLCFLCSFPCGTK